jgi:hypothetical protein
MTTRVEFADNFGRSRGEKPKLASPAHEPVAREPVAPKPAAQEPVAPKPVAPKPAAPKSVAPKPAAREPVAPKPAAREPAAPKPAAQEPVAPKPAAPTAAAQEPPVLEPTSRSGGREAGSAEHEGRTARSFGQDIELVLKRVESSLPGSVPVAIGVGALALVGVLDWPIAVGGAGLYTAYQWLRFGSPLGR